MLVILSKMLLLCTIAGGLLSALASTLSCEGESCPSDYSAFIQLQSVFRDKDSPKHDRLRRKSDNNPFGPNVFVIEPGTLAADVDAALQKIYYSGRDWSSNAQFGDHRNAVFLKPGVHTLDIDLPYYFSVYGLGTKPGDTVVQPGARGYGLQVDKQGNPASTNTFWRSIENVRLAVQKAKWYVSQAAPLRSVIIDGDLALSGSPPDWTSGGCIVNSEIGGSLDTGTQQQWYLRATSFNGFTKPAGIGSYVGIGCTKVNGDEFPPTWSFNTSDQYDRKGLSYTSAPNIFAEKPFIFFDTDGQYKLRIPEVLNDHWGPDWQTGSTVTFAENVYVAQPDTATSAVINEQISSGSHIIFAPGIFKLDAPIVVNNPDTVLLGLGYATLIPTFSGGALIQVGNVDGVRIASLILQAGSDSLKTEALLRWGDVDAPYPGNPANPGFIYDLVGRVGGPDSCTVGVDKMVQINNGYVIGDDLWLWQADHGVFNSGALDVPQRYCNTALEVNGDNVHMYGLMAEHTNLDIVVWNGEYGRTDFFQSEFKYTMGELTKPETWVNISHSTSYRVNAQNHQAVGFGIYTVVYAPEVDDKKIAAMAPVIQLGGFSGIVLKYSDTFKWGMKDISCQNFNVGNTWPEDSKLTCKAWDDTKKLCLNDDVNYFH